MKIPSINQTGVPGAERISTGGIASAAQANIQGGQALVRMVSNYTSQMKKVEAASEYSHHYNRSLTYLDEQYDVLLQQNAFDEKGKPTYHSMIDSWNKIAKKHVTDVASQFNSPIAKSKYQDEVQSYLRTRSADVRGEQRQRQMDFALGTLDQELSRYRTMPDGDQRGQEAINERLTLGLISYESAISKSTKHLNEWAMTGASMTIEQAESDGQLDQVREALMTSPSPYLSASDVNGLFTALRQKEDYLDSKFDDQQEINYTNLTVRILNGDISDVLELELELSQENINPSQFDNLKARLSTDLTGPEDDDWPEYKLVSTNLLNYTPSDILTNTLLTRETRIKLVDDLMKLKTEIETDGEKAANWRSTQQGKEAVRRITAADASTMTFSVGGWTSSTDVEINQMLGDFFDQVEALPLHERKRNVIRIANELVAEYNKDKDGGASGADKSLISIVRDSDPGDRVKLLKDWSTRFATPIPDWAKSISDKTEIDKMAESLGVQ